MPPFSDDELADALAHCAREPVHIPGAIQPAGCLVSLDTDLSRVLQVSANLSEVLGIEAGAALYHPPAHCLGSTLLSRLHADLVAQDGERRILDACLGAAEPRRCRVTAYRSGPRVVVEIEPLGEGDERELLTSIRTWQTRLVALDDEASLLKELVTGVRSLTGHDRVVVYAFDADWNGQVKAECRHAGVDSFLGHRFPASDIPSQVRALYAINPVRSLPDAQAEAVPLVPARCPLSDGALDLSVGALRAVSPVHQQYLHNMGVAASLSIAMFTDDGLWGLVACHGMSPQAFSPAIREAAHMLVQVAVQRLQLLRLEAQQRFRRRVQDSRVLLSEARGELLGPEELVRRHGEGWLALFRCSGVGLVYGDRVSRVGNLPDTARLKRLASWLSATQPGASVWFSSTLGETPLARWVDGHCSCGLLAVPLSVGDARHGWLMLFREEHRETLRWAGRPEDVPERREGRLVMSPRRSFETWQQERAGHSLPWEEAETLAAKDLGEDLAIAASASEISTLNDSLYRERQALAEANQRLEYLAHTDPLTQVWNRHRLGQALDAELNAATRYGRDVTVLLLDIDHFKAVNDRFGHEEGDRVLRLVAQRVWESLRSCDAMGRWGGEEFVVLCSGSDGEDGVGLAHRLTEAVAGIDVGRVGQVTISIGVASWQVGESRSDLIGRADRAMYQAKQQGRDRVDKAV